MVAKLMLIMIPTIDISADNDYIFRRVCEFGHLAVAQWLLSVKPSIDISAENEYAFRVACQNGHLEVAQWLLTIKPDIDISINDELIFMCTCEHKRLEVARWLQSLCPDKYVLVIENNEIVSYYIKRVLPFNAEVVQLKCASKEELMCPICYDEAKQVEVQTSCSHNFCNECITFYYNRTCGGICGCPYCRQPLTSFSRLEIQKQ
jgi:hypothetical protein